MKRLVYCRICGAVFASGRPLHPGAAFGPANSPKRDPARCPVCELRTDSMRGKVDGWGFDVGELYELGRFPRWLRRLIGRGEVRDG